MGEGQVLPHTPGQMWRQPFYFFPFKQWFLASHNRTFVSVLPVLNASAEPVAVVPFCFPLAVLPAYSVLFLILINYSGKKMLIL